METKTENAAGTSAPAAGSARCALEVEYALKQAAVADRASSLAILADELARVKAERDEWRTKHWNAHHHAHQLFLETVRLEREKTSPNSRNEPRLSPENESR